MSDAERYFHELWLGNVRPIDGLVVSIPALIAAQCREPSGGAPQQQRFRDVCPEVDDEGHRAIADLSAFLDQLLGHPASTFDSGAALPDDLSLYVPEGAETLRPTSGLRRSTADAPVTLPDDASPAARAAAPYIAFVLDLPHIDLDRADARDGAWAYPPAAKFDRLLRHARVPIGILTNRLQVRLVYAPHGESSGAITFCVDDMAAVSGRPILDAFVMLLSRTRFFGVAEDRSLPFILADSRKRQSEVTNDLADQVLEAVQLLLAGFERAAERDKTPLLREATERDDGDHVYGGLLTVLLRLVFVLYAEDRGLLPVDAELWSDHYSVLALFDELRDDAAAYPDSMSRRFSAWGRLLSLFRAIYLGVAHGDLHLPPRRGNLFDPERYSFLEGWGPEGGAPILDADARASVRVPSVDDEAVFRLLEKLIVFQGQRLSYRALDVEQLGSVYEALMGYRVEKLDGDAVALRVKAKSSAAIAWVEVPALLATAPNARVAWLEDKLGFDKASAKKAAERVKSFGPTDVAPAIEALLDISPGRSRDRAANRMAGGRLVLQPGPERRRTSSHYTPRELTAPIVRRTLEPLIAVMGGAPSAERILNLKVCDPAMGSGAFLVEACRFLGDEVVKAWTRDGTLPPGGDPTLAARRLVAQRCLYGVDKNAYAVDLAKLSLWLVTLARDLPFTFVDHALRHGDSLVGLDFDQIKSGHWKPGKQLELGETVLREALDEAIAIRQGILELAQDPSPAAQREKERRLGDATDALAHARLLADLIVGAFFAHDKDKPRDKERAKRVDAFAEWKRGGAVDVPAELLEWQREIRAQIPVFHWMLELPEVFYAERPDPLDEGQVNRAAYMDAFVGNPPFLGGRRIRGVVSDGFTEWLEALTNGSKNADLSAHFFRRADSLLGRHGTVGFIATNTISQGDTRAVGLQALLGSGMRVIDAITSLAWPGDAAVSVSVVTLARGTPSGVAGRARLDGVTVADISSHLRAERERTDPKDLLANAGTSYNGTLVNGTGFLLDEPERARLIGQNAANESLIRPYLGGEEINTSPDQRPDRFVIDFGNRTIDEASQWPELLDLVRQRVKPDRDRANREAHRVHWWQFGDKRPALYSALVGLDRCLVASLHTKHLVWAFQPSDRVFSHALIVVVSASATVFSVLQSRVHEPWARRLSSSLEDRLRYSASDCFETFPFPQPDPRTVIPELEDVGQRLYDARAKYMLDDQVGLTITYNRLKDPAVQEPRIVELRRLHEEMDASVLRAYGWSDVAVPPYCGDGPEWKKAVEHFENELVDRLFALNAVRAEEERLKGAGAGSRAKTARKQAKRPATTETRAPQLPIWSRDDE